MNRKTLLWLLLTTASCLLLTASAAQPTAPAAEQPTTPAAAQPTAPAAAQPQTDDSAHVLVLSGNAATLDGAAVPEFDYTWHYDISCAEPYYSGSEPAGDVYIAHDIVYYPSIDASLFSQEKYDGETEWVVHSAAEGQESYLFSTLPVLGSELPVEMMHTAEEAYQNPVLHITKAGTYRLEGTWNGQIWVDLKGEEDCFADAEAKVCLILNGVSIECSVAPGLVFYDVYECDNGWEEREQALTEPDLGGAGAKLVLADGTENEVSGANVFRLLKPTYKKDSDSVQKKLWKMDGALYSFRSLRISSGEAGTGILNVRSTTYEGLDSELHLTIDGGYVTIVSQDDGINVNEDGVSVFTLNGGHLVIFAGQGAEGDVVDSNGYIRVNGGFLAGASPSVSDDLLDSDCGTEVSENATVISNTSGKTPNGFPGGMDGGERPQPPEGFEPREGMEPPDGFGKQPPQDFGKPEAAKP